MTEEKKDSRIACKLCIMKEGLKESEIKEKTFATEEEFQQHLLEEHALPNEMPEAMQKTIAIGNMISSFMKDWGAEYWKYVVKTGNAHEENEPEMFEDLKKMLLLAMGLDPEAEE